MYLQRNIFCFVTISLVKVSFKFFLKEIEEGLGISESKNKFYNY